MTCSTEQPRRLGWRASSRGSLMRSYSPHPAGRGAGQIGQTRMAQLRADHDGILRGFPTSLVRSDGGRRVAMSLSTSPSELFGRHRTPRGAASESCRRWNTPKTLAGSGMVVRLASSTDLRRRELGSCQSYAVHTGSSHRCRWLDINVSSREWTEPNPRGSTPTFCRWPSSDTRDGPSLIPGTNAWDRPAPLRTRPQTGDDRAEQIGRVSTPPRPRFTRPGCAPSSPNASSMTGPRTSVRLKVG